MVSVGYFAWVDVTLRGLHLYRCSMLVRTADENNLLADGPQVACKDVGRELRPY